MKNPLYQSSNFTPSAKQRKRLMLINFDKNQNSNINNCRIESANTNFTSNSNHNIILQNKNFANQSNSSENYYPSKQKRELYYKPNWKYSYYLDKNDIISLNYLNIKKNSEIKKELYDFKDIDKRPKPIVYSWTKPRMIKILENNSLIEEEVKSHYWKYSHIFENNNIKQPGKLLRILMTQLSQGYGGELNAINYYNNGLLTDVNFNNKKLKYQQWKVPGKNKNFRNNYELIKIKRPKSAYKF